MGFILEKGEEADNKQEKMISDNPKLSNYNKQGAVIFTWGGQY